MKLKASKYRTASPVSYPKVVRRSSRISSSSSPSLKQDKQPTADFSSESSFLDSKFVIFTPLATASSLPDPSCSERVSSHYRRRKGKADKKKLCAKDSPNVFSSERDDEQCQGRSVSAPSLNDVQNSVSNPTQSLNMEMGMHLNGEVRGLRRTSSCTTIGRKRVVVTDEPSHEVVFRTCNSPSSSSSSLECTPRKRFASPRTPSSGIGSRLSALSSTPSSTLAPKTPCSSTFRSSMAPISPDDEEYGGDSLLELLPLDLLLRVVCCLQHDDLKPVALVCKRIKKAVLLARRYHFSYTTPHRERNGKTSQLFPCIGEHSGLQGKLSVPFVRPPTPNAPRHVSKPAESRLSDVDIRPFAPPLFQQEPQENVVITSNNHLRKTKRILGMASHRVLFNEDELCQAVAQNTL